MKKQKIIFISSLILFLAALTSSIFLLVRYIVDKQENYTPKFIAVQVKSGVDDSTLGEYVIPGNSFFYDIARKIELPKYEKKQFKSFTLEDSEIKYSDTIKSDSIIIAEYYSFYDLFFHNNFNDQTTYYATYREDKIISLNDLINIPAPNIVGWELEGAYLDKELTNRYVPRRLGSNLTIYLNYVRKPSTIRFWLDLDKTQLWHTVTLEWGSVIESVPEPTKDNYTFIGWKVKSLWGDFLAGDPIEFPYTIEIYQADYYADFVFNYLDSYTFTFINSLDDSIIAQYEVPRLQSVGPPTPPNIEGYNFAGWFTYENGEKVYDITWQSLNKNMNIYAEYTKVQEEYLLIINLPNDEIKTLIFNQPYKLLDIELPLLVGFYEDALFTRHLNLYTVRTTNMVVYAKIADSEENVDKQTITITSDVEIRLFLRNGTEILFDDVFTGTISFELSRINSYLNIATPGGAYGGYRLKPVEPLGMRSFNYGLQGFESQGYYLMYWYFYVEQNDIVVQIEKF